MEMALQYMWENRIYSGALSLCDGTPVRILHPGRQNHDSGPDYSNARVRIGETLWVGNVEVHLRATDWFRHRHQADPAYGNIILHVVGVDDGRIHRNDGSEIPQLCIPLTPHYAQLYARLVENGTIHIRCADKLHTLPAISTSDWIEALAMQRLQEKAQRILDTLARHRGDWQQACFVTLARALGFGVNSEPFEQLANRLPLNIIHHHSDNPEQLHALVFGLAGMLSPGMHPADGYHRFLCNEFAFLCRKYNLSPMQPHLWKRSRMRPAGMPCRRLALLARMLEGGFSLMRDILEAKGEIARLQELLNVRLEGYWASHYAFEVPCSFSSPAISAQSIDLLLINVAASLYYAYGMHMGDPAWEEMAADLLCSLPAEKNGIISTWSNAGIKPRNAFESQALLQLRRNYCDTHRCLQCRWGNKLLRLCSTS